MIKTIDVKPGDGKDLPIPVISLTNGNAEELSLALPGSFKGRSDFVEMELPASAVRTILFR